jgi:putative Holliday junction resolvase
MRHLAVDLGARRVGLALSDEGGRFATPLDVLEVRTPAEALAAIEAVVRREGVERIVLGLPLNMDETAGAAARSAVAFGRELEKATGKEVIYVDERLSSFEAEQSLMQRKRAGEKLTRRQKKQRLDAIAAAGFLAAFLDGKLPAIDVSGYPA